jgi:hypothetical protein
MACLPLPTGLRRAGQAVPRGAPSDIQALWKRGTCEWQSQPLTECRGSRARRGSRPDGGRRANRRRRERPRAPSRGTARSTSVCGCSVNMHEDGCATMAVVTQCDQLLEYGGDAPHLNAYATDSPPRPPPRTTTWRVISIRSAGLTSTYFCVVPARTVGYIARPTSDDIRRSEATHNNTKFKRDHVSAPSAAAAEDKPPSLPRSSSRGRTRRSSGSASAPIGAWPAPPDAEAGGGKAAPG